MKITKIISLLISLTAFGCLDQIDVNLGEEPVLIIDGGLTDQPGPHVVNLRFSTGFNKIAIFEKIRSEVIGAVVEIVDNQGTRERLIELRNGKYQTKPEYQGLIGKTYHLEVLLNNGNGYTSIPEKMVPVPEIQSGSFEKRAVEFATETSIGTISKVFFKIDFQDDPESVNYYRWRYRGTYQIFAPLGDLPDTCVVSCEVCWETIPDCWATAFDFQFLNVASDEGFSGKQVSAMEVYSTNVDRQFNIGYSSLIEQHSLSERAFTYWSNLKNQIGNNGSIFETPNFQINGNIRSENDPEEFVIGYFGVSAVSSTRIFVARSDVGKTPGDIPCGGTCIPPACIDCEQWPATQFKPDFWPN